MKKEWIKDAFNVAEKARGGNEEVQVMNVYITLHRALEKRPSDLKKLSEVLDEKADEWKDKESDKDYVAFYLGLKEYVDEDLAKIKKTV